MIHTPSYKKKNQKLKLTHKTSGNIQDFSSIAIIINSIMNS